jgi:uracil-DNA glycosylase family 4
MIPRCPACPVVPNRCPIPSSGPVPCIALFLAEAPSRHEDAHSMPLSYSGQSGMEFNNYLGLAGLSRDQVHVSNVFICSLPSYKNPTEAQAAACSARHLPDLLARVQPKVILTMGAIAASVFGDVDLQTVHGIPQWRTYGSWSGWVVHTFHPAFALRSTAAMIPIRSDFEALGRLLKNLENGDYIPPTDPYPNPDYRIIRTVHDLNDYLPRGERFWDMSEDTENRPDGSPYCLTFSHTPGTARLIYAHNHAAIKAYNSYLECFRPLQHMQNWLHDDVVRSKMGLTYARFMDTMIRAYELGIGGGGDDDENDAGSARGALGLKVLAFRHLHMTMTSFKDTVMPHTLPHVVDWLLDAKKLSSAREQKIVCECGHGQEVHEEKGKTKRRTGPCSVCWPRSDPHKDELSLCPKWRKVTPPKTAKTLSLLHRKVNMLLDQLWDGKAGVDPWKRLGEWPDSERGLLEGLLGPMPVLDVALLPEDVLTYYACRDADSALRLALFLNSYRIR